MPLECVYKHQKEKIFYVVINRTNLHTYTHFSNSLLKRKEFFVRDDEKNELIQADYCSYDLISMLDAIVKKICFIHGINPSKNVFYSLSSKKTPKLRQSIENLLF